MGKKKQRQQPRPKKKKRKEEPKRIIGFDFLDKMKKYSDAFFKSVSDKEMIKKKVRESIDKIEAYFKKYDTVQLLGSVGLYLIDNLNTLEKAFISKVNGTSLELDEEAEVIAEYAMNFGLALSNECQEEPPYDVVYDLRETLRMLKQLYTYIDIPIGNDNQEWISSMIHSQFISVRGDGYQVHTEEVFREMFFPHSPYFQQQYGYTAEELFDFLTRVENRVICKIASQNMIYGACKMHERWREWEERTYGKLDDLEDFKKRNLSMGLFGDFFKANPDVSTTIDKQRFLMYQPDDYTSSEMIFWVYPQNEIELKILESLSVTFGENSSFLIEGEYKGNIMNGRSIFERPFVKDGDKHYCFTPMLPHRNLFLIAEKLMMRNDKNDNYYSRHFKEQSSLIGKDNYVERKVRLVLESFLSNVKFESSVRYKITEDGMEKKPELDIIGVSEKANYLIEVKAHELTINDRVKIKGTLDKFKASVSEACYQCNRAKKSIFQNTIAQFTNSNGVITIDKSKPVFKIAVTFQHFSVLLGDFDCLVQANLMKEEYRDTLVISLFDLMVMSDFIQSEDEWIEYLNIHNEIYAKKFKFMDELEVLNGFINHDMVKQVHKNKTGIIGYGTKEIDDEYVNDFS